MAGVKMQGSAGFGKSGEAGLVREGLVGWSRRPIPGDYYRLHDGRLMLCIAEKIAAGERYYWFIDAETAPLTVLSGRELDMSPVVAVALSPVREKRVNGGFSEALEAVVAQEMVVGGGIKRD